MKIKLKQTSLLDLSQYVSQTDPVASIHYALFTYKR